MLLVWMLYIANPYMSRSLLFCICLFDFLWTAVDCCGIVMVYADSSEMVCFIQQGVQSMLVSLC